MADQPLGIRLNNPLNIRFSSANDWVGQVGSESGFAKFDSPSAGVRAADVLLTNYGQQGVRSPRDVINRFAPPSENDTDNYVNFVADTTGLDPDAELDLENPTVRRNLLNAMARMETGSDLNELVPSEDAPQFSPAPQRPDPVVAEALETEYSIEQLLEESRQKFGRDRAAVAFELGVLDTTEELQSRPPPPLVDGQEPDPSDPNVALEAIAGINRGILGAADETSQFVGEIAEFLGAEGVGQFLQEVDLRGTASRAGIGNTETFVGDLTAGVSQFLTGFIPTVRAARAAATAKGTAGELLQFAAAGAVVDAVAFDPHEARLSNLIEDQPGLSNPITSYLASDPDDTAAEGRFKNAIEGLGLGALTDGLFIAIKGLKGIRRGKANDEAADAMIAPRELAEPPARANEPDIEADVDAANRPAQSPQDPSTAVEPAAPRADIEADEGVQPKSFFDADAFRARLTLDPTLRAKLAARIEAGDLNDAEDLIDFNANTVDWDKLEDPEQVRQLINTTSEVLADFIDDVKGGVQTHAMTRKLGNLVNGSAEQVSKLFADVRGDHGITARLFSAQRVLTASADRLRVLAKEGAANPTQANELAFFRQVELHGLVQAQIKGVGTEVARALNSMRQLKAADTSSFDEFDSIIRQAGGNNSEHRRRMMNKLAELRDEGAVNKFVRKSRFQRGTDVAVEVYINGLLSALSTLNLNNVANAVKIVDGLQEQYVAAAIGKLRNTEGRTSFAEVNARAYGTVAGMRHAMGITLSDIRKSDWREIVEKVGQGNVAKAFREETPQLDTRQRVDADTRKAISSTGDDANAKAINAIGKLVRIPSRLIMTSDELFKNIAFHQELHAAAYRRATQVADGLDVTGAKRTAVIEREIRLVLADPPEDLRFQALDFARYQTFQADLEGQAVKGVEDWLNRNPAFKFIVPFFRTPVNIVKQAIVERSPLPLIKGSHSKIWQNIAAGGPQADLQLARLAIGGVFMGTAAMWVTDGKLTGSGLNNGSRRNTEALDGIPPYSVKIGDTWFQYNRLEPMGLLMGLAADFTDMSALYGTEELDEIGEAASMVLTVLATNITDKTWFKGITDMITAMDDPKRYFNTYTKNLVTTAIVPYSSALRRSTSDFDETAREAFTWMDTLRSKLPGLSSTLPPKHDLLGNPIQRTDYVGPAFLSPFAVGREKGDPLYAELARLEMFYDKPSRAIFIPGQDVDAATFSEFMRIRGTEKFNGQSMQDVLSELITDRRYTDQMSDVGRRETVARVVSTFGRLAREKMLRDNPQLLAEARAARRQEQLDRLQQP